VSTGDRGTSAPGAAGWGGPELGQLAVPLGIHGVGRLPLGDHLAAVLGKLIGSQVALLGSGAGQDVVGRGPGRGTAVPELVEQVGHWRSSSIFPLI
jgi:hypothetical protein